MTGTDRIPRSFCVLVFASWSCLLCGASALAAPPHTSVVDDDTLYRLLVKELAATLERRGQLVPLPRNIQDVVIGAAGDPWFVVPVVDPDRPASLETTLDRLDPHEPGFRILWEGSVVGRDRDRGMMIAAADPMSPRRPSGPSSVAIMDHDTTSTIAVAAGVRQAIRVGDRHVLLTDAGLVTKGEAVIWTGSKVLSRMAPVRMLPVGPNGLAVFASSQGPDGLQQLRLGLFDGDGQDTTQNQKQKWSIRTISGLGRHPVSAVVRLQDGQWLAITDRIIEIDADWHPRDTANLYRGQSVRVMQVLRQDTADSAVLVIETRDEANRSRGYAVARLEPDGSLHPSCELPDRWWGPRGASGWVRDASDGVCGIIVGKGLARLSERGLEWLGEGGRLAGNMKVVAADAHGRVYLRETRHRPGTMENADTEVLWVFSASSADELKDSKPPAAEPFPVAIWPLFSDPTAGAAGEVWFLTLSPQALSELRERGATLPADTAGVVTKKVVVADATKPDRAATSHQTPDDVQEAPVRLLRLDSPTTVTEYPNVELPSLARLVAGRSAIWIEGITGSRDQDRLVFFDGTSFFRGGDVHALATTHFDAMLAAAPTAMLPGVQAYLPHADKLPPSFQILRTGNLLWVCGSGRVEVYDKGCPLSVSDRLQLRETRRLEHPRLIGPLDRGDGQKSIVLLTAPGEIERFVWITPTDVGITIDQAEPPPREFSPGVSLHVPGRFAGLPLVSDDASWLATCNGLGRVWQIFGPKTYVPMPDAGDPILTVPKTDAFLARRGDLVRSGVRICSPTVRRDVPVTFTTRLDPVAFAADGRLLCFAPDGVAWLTPDAEKGYVLSERRLLPHDLSPQTFVAAVGTSVVITAAVPSGETCLVAIPTPPQGP